jgi:rhodanese-related sulfurtransferase
MKKLIAVLLLSVFTLTACGGSGEQVINLAVNEFAQKIADPTVVILDVRTPAEFASGHITGAVNVDFESGSFEQDIQALDKTKTYAVYCRSGNRSGQATSIMAKNGFSSVFNLNGGVIDWTALGQVLVTQ